MWKLNPLKNGSYQTAHLQTSLTCNPEYLHAARLHSTTVTFPCSAERAKTAIIAHSSSC